MHTIILVITVSVKDLRNVKRVRSVIREKENLPVQKKRLI